MPNIIAPPEAEVAERFKRDTANHSMTVLREDGPSSAPQDDALAEAVAAHGPFPMPVGTGPEPMTPDREQIRAELLAEFVAWLVKKAREYRAQGPQYAKQADVIGRLADKASRGAVRPDNLLSLPPQGGPEDVPALLAEVDRLRARVAKLEAGSPWERAVSGLNALADADIAFWIEPDGHISGPFSDEHIEWDQQASRWRLAHDDEDDVHPPHPAPCRHPASPMPEVTS